MADKLISELTNLPSGSIEGADLVEVQESDQVISKKVTVTVLNELEKAERVAQDDVIEASVGLDANGAYPGFSGSNYLDVTADVMDALDALDNAIGASSAAIVTEMVSVSYTHLTLPTN